LFCFQFPNISFIENPCVNYYKEHKWVIFKNGVRVGQLPFKKCLTSVSLIVIESPLVIYLITMITKYDVLNSLSRQALVLLIYSNVIFILLPLYGIRCQQYGWQYTQIQKKCYTHFSTPLSILYVRLDRILTCGKHFLDLIISLIFSSLTSPLFDEVPVLSHESERSCKCVLGVNTFIHQY
jgi:hypothetical protein